MRRLILFLITLPLFAAPISLFDGKTLDGWELVDRDRQFWRAEDGMIIADSLGKKMPRNTFLFSEKTYEHFEFRCQFRLTGDPKTGLVNSGIQFRSEKLANGYAKGYQADIGEPKWWGCIYDEHRRNRVIATSDLAAIKTKLKPFGWNEYVIRAEGPRVRMYLNGILTVDYTEPDPNIPLSGHFALQLHSGGICQIAYKDITVEILKPPAPKKGRPDIPFADFESGSYEGWTTTGTAFGDKPLEISKAPEYQENMHASGKYCVNSHASSPGEPTVPNIAMKDGATGTLTSDSFTIERDFIQLKVNGGDFAGQTCVNVLVDGQTVASVTGNRSNTMSTKLIPVANFAGKKAQLQVVDSISAGWGNIGIDDVVFTDGRAQWPTPKKKAPSGRKPEQELASFTLPEGFVAELVASEADGLINPIDMTFDDAGRLWTQTAEMYPLDPVPNAAWSALLRLMDDPKAVTTNPAFRRAYDLYTGKAPAADKILIISKSGEVSVWAEGLANPQSVLPYKTGAFVAHGPELLFLDDRDGDGKADHREVLLSGFGFVDTHTMSHLLIRAPGGWINFSHGALNKGLVTATRSGVQQRVDYAKNLRLSLDGTRFELVNAGLNNIWGYQLRANGQWYGSEANDLGWSVVPMEASTAYKGIGNQKLRDYQPLFPPLHKFRVGGTGLSGIAFCEDRSGSFPAAYKNVAFIANPITRKINAVRIKRLSDGRVEGEHLPDFLTSTDEWFRPVNLAFGPDGCLYVADFYNKIISHNEVSRAHPDRDKSHGRIWRIRHTGATAPNPVNIAALPDAQLPAQLRSDSDWARRAAWQQIVDRNAKNLVPAISAIVADHDTPETSRIAALWTLEGLGHFDRALWGRLLADAPADLRREAVRALANLPIDSATLADVLTPLSYSADAMLRSQLLRTIEAHGKSHPDLIDFLLSFCGPDVPGNSLGGPYERKFERYLARRALEPNANALADYLRTPQARRHSDAHIAWASQALAPNQAEAMFLKQWPTIRKQPIDLAVLTQISDMLRSPQVAEAVGSAFDSDLLKLTLDNAAKVYSPELAALFTPVAQRLFASDQALALRAADELHVPGLEAQLEALADNPVASRILARGKPHPPAPVSVQPPSKGTEKIEHFTRTLANNPGDAALGKPIFDGLCLSCHSVGGKGAGFSPPLDGSGHRELEHLLTAIFTPDAAMEGNYSLYSVQRADGTRMEGYLEKKDKRGVTLRFMGGGSVFLPSVDIVAGDYVPGRSVMPTGLIDSLPDAQVANLIAYIQSLK